MRRLKVASVWPSLHQLPCVVIACVGEEKLFLYPVRFSVGGLQIKLTKDRLAGGGKKHLIIYLSMRIHKEMGLKEEVRIWGLHTILIGDREGQSHHNVFN